MKVLENSYANLPKGVVVVLSGKSLNDISFIKEKEINWQVDEDKRSDATKYAQFVCGGRSFTVQNNQEDIIELLKNRKARTTLAEVRLEATEYQREEIDPESKEPTGNNITVKTFRFISATTLEDALAFAKSEGMVAQEEAKWAPKQASVSQANIDAAVAKSMTNFLKNYVPAAPVVAPVQAAAEPVED